VSAGKGRRWNTRQRGVAGSTEGVFRDLAVFCVLVCLVLTAQTVQDRQQRSSRPPSWVRQHEWKEHQRERGIKEKQGAKVTRFRQDFCFFAEEFDEIGVGGQRHQRTRPLVIRLDKVERDLLLKY